MPIYEIDGLRPVVDASAFVHSTAVLIGDVIVGPGAYIAPHASLRGDFGRLIVGPGANVQDSCTMHGFPGTDTVIEEDGHIGHGAVLHGCTVRANAMVGMNSVVMDGAVIGESAFVAALTFVKAKFEVPARTLVAGVPGRIVRELTAEEIGWKRAGTAEYQQLTRRSLATLRECAPLSAPEPDRRRFLPGDLAPKFVTEGR